MPQLPQGPQVHQVRRQVRRGPRAAAAALGRAPSTCITTGGAASPPPLPGRRTTRLPTSSWRHFSPRCSAKSLTHCRTLQQARLLRCQPAACVCRAHERSKAARCRKGMPVGRAHLSSCLLGRGICVSSAKNFHRAAGWSPATADAPTAMPGRCSSSVAAVTLLLQADRHTGDKRTGLRNCMCTALGRASLCARAPDSNAARMHAGGSPWGCCQQSLTGLPTVYLRLLHSTSAHVSYLITI